MELLVTLNIVLLGALIWREWTLARMRRTFLAAMRAQTAELVRVTAVAREELDARQAALARKADELAAMADVAGDEYRRAVARVGELADAVTAAARTVLTLAADGRRVDA
jgi:hypothetical protein